MLRRSNSRTKGHDTVSLIGGGFGAADSTPAMRTGATSCLATKWVTDSMVRSKCLDHLFSSRHFDRTAVYPKLSIQTLCFRTCCSQGSLCVLGEVIYRRSCRARIHSVLWLRVQFSRAGPLQVECCHGRWFISYHHGQKDGANHVPNFVLRQA